MFELRQIRERIFLLSFESKYDLGMHFLRYQEYYESPKFKGKVFTLIDYMEWYAEEHDGVFSYPNDWSGYNLPSVSILELWEKGIPDVNKYDIFMENIYDMIKRTIDNEEFYLIGTTGDGSTLRHELAHGLYYTEPEYKQAMYREILNISIGVRDVLSATLIEMGYDKDVVNDEMQAYLSTGLASEMIKALKKKKFSFVRLCKPFKEVFAKWHE